MKSLLYIANLRLPTEKAYGIQIAKMCEAFADPELKFKVALIYPKRNNPNIKENVFDYYSVKNNFEAKRVWAPDFYFSGKLDTISVLIKNFISAFLLSIYKNNLIFEAHRFSNSRKMFYRRFKNINLKVVVITKHLKEDFLRIGFRPENILIAPDGVDLAEFDTGVSKEGARGKTGLPLNARIAMYTGHLFEWKGANALLETARQCKDVLFVFVGGMSTDIDKFKVKAKSMELNNVLVLGHQPHRDIPIFLKAADVLLLPNSSREDVSRSYTSPLKLFEYMASKRPITASDIPSLREVLDEDIAVFAVSDD